jgi:hypothetical protein
MDNTIPYVNMEGKENLAKNRPPIFVAKIELSFN